MTKVKLLIREYDKEKDAIKKLVVLGAIQDELEHTKKDLLRKVK